MEFSVTDQMLEEIDSSRHNNDQPSNLSSSSISDEETPRDSNENENEDFKRQMHKTSRILYNLQSIIE